MKKTETTQTEIKTEIDPQPQKIDLDAFMKELLTNFLQDAVALINPDLHDAVDWTVAPRFLEQELINSLKGRFKGKDKRKYTDKLVKLRLKSGKDYYIILHVEAQHEPENDFNKRMYIYRCLIYLWSDDVDDITAIAIFTGVPPVPDSLEYNHKCFGTEIMYRFTSYVAVEQNEQELLESENPFAIAVLATKYTYQTVNNAERRFAFKRKVFELAQKKDIPIDKMTKLLTFVNDFMYLPKALEQEFEEEGKSFSNFLKPHSKMGTIVPHSEGTLRIMNNFLVQTTGKSVDEYLIESAETDALKMEVNAERRKTKQAETQMKRAERERNQIKAKAERERKQFEAQAERERKEIEEKAELERENTIVNLYSKASLSMETIATMLSLKLEYVKKIIDIRLEKQ